MLSISAENSGLSTFRYATAIEPLCTK